LPWPPPHATSTGPTFGPVNWNLILDLAFSEKPEIPVLLLKLAPATASYSATVVIGLSRLLPRFMPTLTFSAVLVIGASARAGAATARLAASESASATDFMTVSPDGCRGEAIHGTSLSQQPVQRGGETDTVARRSSLPQPTRPPRMAMTTDLTTT